MPDKMIPLCRIYENESQRTGKKYLLGNLTFTSKIVGFPSEDEHGNACYQLFIQERPPRTPASQAAEPPVSTQEHHPAADRGGIDAGDMPSGRYPKPDASAYGQGVLALKRPHTAHSDRSDSNG